MLMTPMEPTRPLYESIHTWLYGVKEQAMKKRKEELSSICGGGGGWGQNKIHVGLCRRPLFLLFLFTYSCVCVSRYYCWSQPNGGYTHMLYLYTIYTHTNKTKVCVNKPQTHTVTRGNNCWMYACFEEISACALVLPK